MPDDTTDTIAPVAATAVVETPAPAAPVEKVFTQDQVNAFVQQRLAADRAARSKVEPKAEPQKPTPAPADVDVHAELIEMKHRLAYEKRTAKLELEDSKSDALFKIYKADPQGFDEAVALFGLKNPTPAAPAAPTATTTEQRPAPAAAPSAPVANALPTANGLPDLFAMTPAQHQALGPAKVREALEAAWKIGNQMSGAPQRRKAPPRT
jgi:hypothetical protein